MNGSSSEYGGGLAALLPSVMANAIKTSLTLTLVLYVLNQNHLLPRPLSAIVSKVLFWPTLPITASKRMGKWMTVMDDTVVLGGAPFGFLHIPERLYNKYRVRGVINLCEEYRGPMSQYLRLGMRQLHLPTTDHFEPTVDDLESAIDFIAQYQKHGDRVYVHCRAGHGRSAAVVFAWLLQQQQAQLTESKDHGVVDLEALNQKMSRLRNVRKGLWRQPNIILFHKKMLKKRSINRGTNNTND
jgi:atypical dual specificity phosphatase